MTAPAQQDQAQRPAPPAVQARVGGVLASGKRAVRRAEQRARFGSDLVWRYGLNTRSTLDHRRRPPRLAAEALRVLADLRRDGYAVSDLGALTGDPSALQRLQRRADELAAARATSLQRGSGAAEAEAAKPYLVELLDSRRPVVHPLDVLARTAADAQLKGVADAYFGLTTVVADLNVWRNLPTGGPPRSSQLWHRDLLEDRVVLKAFVYLADVPVGAGPFAYAAGTHRCRDRELGVQTVFDGMNHRVPSDQAVGLLPRERVLTGPAGTVVLADTLGYHRGGWATDTERTVLQIRYASGAARAGVRLGLPPGVDARAWRRTFAYARPTS